MPRDDRTSKVEAVFREVLEDDEPAVQESEAGVGKTRRLGSDAGAAQAIYAGAPQAPGLASEREGDEPLPPENRRIPGAGEEGDMPATLDPSRTDVDRNAAGGGWAGVSEVLESDYEVEQLRLREAEGEAEVEGDVDAGVQDPDEGEPHERERP